MPVKPLMEVTSTPYVAVSPGSTSRGDPVAVRPNVGGGGMSTCALAVRLTTPLRAATVIVRVPGDGSVEAWKVSVAVPDPPEMTAGLTVAVPR